MSDFLSCKDCVDLLLDYLDDTLDSETRERLDEHFSACPPCVNFLKTYKTSTHIASLLQSKKVEVPGELEERLRNFLHENL